MEAFNVTPHPDTLHCFGLCHRAACHPRLACARHSVILESHTMNTLRQNILQALTAFVNSRPGLEFCNYGDVSAYRSEMRSITKDRAQALEMLSNVAWRESITAEMIINAAEHSFSGRLSIIPAGENNGVRIEYCTGQYYPTEYRRAVCAVLSSVLWSYWRDNSPVKMTRDDIRKTAARELSRSIATRWFR